MLLKVQEIGMVPLMALLMNALIALQVLAIILQVLECVGPTMCGANLGKAIRLDLCDHSQPMVKLTQSNELWATGDFCALIPGTLLIVTLLIHK